MALHKSRAGPVATSAQKRKYTRLSGIGAYSSQSEWFSPGETQLCMHGWALCIPVGDSVLGTSKFRDLLVHEEVAGQHRPSAAPG